MKNLILFLCAIACATTLNAQLSGIGFRPMVTISNYKLANDLDDNYDVNMRPGGGASGEVVVDTAERAGVMLSRRNLDEHC